MPESKNQHTQHIESILAKAGLKSLSLSISALVILRKRRSIAISRRSLPYMVRWTVFSCGQIQGESLTQTLALHLHADLLSHFGGNAVAKFHQRGDLDQQGLSSLVEAQAHQFLSSIGVNEMTL